MSKRYQYGDDDWKDYLEGDSTDLTIPFLFVLVIGIIGACLLS